MLNGEEEELITREERELLKEELDLQDQNGARRNSLHGKKQERLEELQGELHGRREVPPEELEMQLEELKTKEELKQSEPNGAQRDLLHGKLELLETKLEELQEEQHGKR